MLLSSKSAALSGVCGIVSLVVLLLYVYHVVLEIVIQVVPKKKPSIEISSFVVEVDRVISIEGTFFRTPSKL
jgi:hypothetical protein